jgi:hypothetical protein
MSRTGPLGPATVGEVTSICRFLAARSKFYPTARERGFEQHECNLIGFNDTLVSLALPMCWVAANQALSSTRIELATAYAAAKQILEETVLRSELPLTLGKWVVSRSDLLAFVKQMRETYPDITEDEVRVVGMPLATISLQLLMNRFTQISEDMAEAAKGAPPPEEFRTRTVYGITAMVLQAASSRFDGSAIADVGSREYYDYIAFLPIVAEKFNAACSAMVDLDRGISTGPDGGRVM